jgi:4-oxalocrotonate tautomerase
VRVALALAPGNGGGTNPDQKASEMPIINIRFIKDVVATEEQKVELIEKMTDTFVGVLGDVVRPFTYCIIDEVPIGLWGIGGVPMPDLPYLVGEDFAEVREKSNQTMRDAIAQMAADAEKGADAEKAEE